MSSSTDRRDVVRDTVQRGQVPGGDSADDNKDSGIPWLTGFHNELYPAKKCHLNRGNTGKQTYYSLLITGILWHFNFCFCCVFQNWDGEIAWTWKQPFGPFSQKQNWCIQTSNNVDSLEIFADTSYTCINQNITVHDKKWSASPLAAPASMGLLSKISGFFYSNNQPSTHISFPSPPEAGPGGLHLQRKEDKLLLAAVMGLDLQCGNP